MTMQKNQSAPTQARGGMKRWLAAATCALALLAVASPVLAQRTFAPRYTNTAVNGDIVGIGNVVMNCAAGAATGTCLASRTDTNGSGGTNNNNFTMVYIDTDSDAATFNSSSATLGMPAGSTVLFAGLYWAGESTNTARNTIRFRTPSTVVNLTASQLDTIGSAYQGFVDVTSLVSASGNGVYTGGSIQGLNNTTNAWAGWSLVVAYRNPASSLRNLSVFDGWQLANGTNPQVDIAVSGFLTPAAGAVTSTLGALAWDGDRNSNDGSAGFQFGASTATLSTVSNAVNPAANFWNSTISNNGVHVTAGRTPPYTNTLGMDLDFVVPNVPLPNGATSAALRLQGSGSEFIWIGMISLAIDVFQPALKADLLKASQQANAAPLYPGEELIYTISTRNSGNDDANNVIVRDPIPPNTTYVPGSLQIVSGANAGNKTDAAGDDQAEFDAANNRVVFRIGTGANATQGGRLNVNESFSVRFRVRVNNGTAGGTVVNNSAVVDFTGVTLGTAVEDTSDSDPATPGDQPTADVVSALSSDLSITKTNTPGLGAVDQPADTLTRGTTTVYSIVAANGGPTAADGTVLRDPPLAGLTCTTATCAVTTGTATCPTATGAALVTALQSTAGAVIPTMGANSSVTVTLTCTVQ